MSSGNPFYHFAACNMCSFPVTHSTNILVSLCLQHHGPTMCYPCVLSLSLSSILLSWTFSLPLHLFMRGSIEPIPQDFRYVCISCQVACHLPPHIESGQRARLCGAASHPLSSQQQCCQRCGHRKYILLRNLFVTAASPRPGCKQMLYFWSSHSLTLS